MSLGWTKRSQHKSSLDMRGDRICFCIASAICWDVVEKLIQRGCTSDTAVDGIYLF